MAPPPAAGPSKPKRKRQRRRREVSSEPSSAESSDSSEDEEEASEPVTAKLPTPSASSSSSSEASSSSEDESSDDGRGRRRGKGPKGTAAPTSSGPNGAGTAAAATVTNARRPCPSRSPSPAAFNPANLPLGQTPFPLLKDLADGPILAGFVPGDKGFGDKEGEVEVEVGAKVESERAREEKFGDWWRARLVSEFETELGGLAAEPGLTPGRLALLLTSLTSLSSLHTTSSSLASAGKSIWLHDPSTVIDPLAALEVDDSTQEWGKAVIGGEGDVEVGEEGVTMDAEKEMGIAAEANAMQVDQ